MSDSSLPARGRTDTPVGRASASARQPLLHADGSAVRVLVVDDERSLTDLLSMALRYEGWEVQDRRRRADRDQAGP